MDSMLILDIIWQKSIVHQFPKLEWYNKSFPYLWHPITGMILSATVFMVVAVSAERYRAICHPLSNHHVSTTETKRVCHQLSNCFNSAYPLQIGILITLILINIFCSLHTNLCLLLSPFPSSRSYPDLVSSN